MVAFNLKNVAIGLLLCSSAHAASSADWRSRTIYQVMTDRFALTSGSTSTSCDTSQQVYCGGSWQGITNQLDYIQNMGFDAIWISPITYQLQGNTPDGSAYHGYWQQNLFELNSNFGSADDLKNLASEMHNRGMVGRDDARYKHKSSRQSLTAPKYLMVDIVTNHFAAYSSPANIDYSTFQPFNDASYFHSFCEIDYNDTGNMTQFQVCWEGDQTVPLVDLRTEDSNVVSQFQTWISQLVSEYSVDGLRIDSVMEVNYDFWSPFLESAGVYAVGEVDNGDPGLVCGYQNYLPGVLNYGTYFPLVAAFESTSGSISNLANAINAVKGSCQDTSLLGTFSENHDQPRFAQLNSDMSQARNVVTFTMLADGIPIIYEGQEQHYNSLGGSGVPYNREAVWLSSYNQNAPLYTLIQTLNAARKNAIAKDASYLTYRNWPIYTDTTTIAMRKGDMVTVLSNKGSDGASYSQIIPAGYSGNTQLTELLTCNTVTADGSGNINVPMANGLPRVYYPTASLSGSGLCGASSQKARSEGWRPRQGKSVWRSKITE